MGTFPLKAESTIDRRRTWFLKLLERCSEREKADDALYRHLTPYIAVTREWPLSQNHKFLIYREIEMAY